MVITNKNNYPEPLYNAICYVNKKYSKGNANYSATELCSSTRQVILKQRYSNEISRDAEDLLWAFFGQVIHFILEKHAGEQSLAEERLYHKFGDITISGCADCYTDGILQDYKVTSVYVGKQGEPKPEWVQQLNILKFLYEKAGFKVKKLENVLILRDHFDRHKIEIPSKVKIVTCPIWETSDTEHFIKNKILSLNLAKDLPDDKLPFCSDADRWADLPTFAVKKKRVKKAIRLFDNLPQAEGFLKGLNDKDAFIEKREGNMYKRCEKYCDYKQYCNQYLESKNVKQS
jgi:hypothetical protein